MTLGDLIKNKDYDLINVFVTASPHVTNEKYAFFGVCKSENGELISLDGDSYDKSEEIIEYEEFSNEYIKTGLDVFCHTEWIYMNKSSSYTTFYDQLILYAVIRKSAKGLRSNKLTDVAHDEIKIEENII